MKIMRCPPYSDEYWQAKKGLPSASNFHRIITPAKWEYAAGAYSYACELIAQEYDYNYGAHEEYATAAMRNGIIMEPEARRAYEFYSGRDVEQVGLCISDCSRFCCSPDGLVGDEGGIELKHPTAATHVKWLLAGVLPPEHAAQCYGFLLVTKRQWIDFMAWYPGMPQLVVRVTPDEKMLKMAEALEKFATTLADMRRRIAERNPAVMATREPQESYF